MKAKESEALWWGGIVLHRATSGDFNTERRFYESALLCTTCTTCTSSIFLLRRALAFHEHTDTTFFWCTSVGDSRTGITAVARILQKRS